MEILSFILVVGAVVFAWQVGRVQGADEQNRLERERDEEWKARLVSFFCESDYLAKPSLPDTKSMQYWKATAHIGPLSLVRTVDLMSLAIRAELNLLNTTDLSESEATQQQNEIASMVVERFLELSSELPPSYAASIREHFLFDSTTVVEDIDDEEEEVICANCDGAGEVDCPLRRISYDGGPCPSDCPACHGAQRVACLDCQEPESLLSVSDQIHLAT